jgi:glycosyltransferase involved in cell wall biosynthesis
MVSIVIINYNDKVRVQRAIESALEQTYKDKEIILVDDGSDEETRKIYENYDVNLVQLEREDKSLRTPSRARNAGIKEAKGDYICFLDSDNYYDKEFVEECMKFPADVMYCNWSIVGLEAMDIDIERVWKSGQGLLENYLQHQHLDHQCLLIKRSVLDKAGYYDDRLPRSQDCDLIVRLMLNSEEFKHISKRLFFFEKHEEDQNKWIASVYGKALWTLKQAIQDFKTKDEWKEDYEKSAYKKFEAKVQELLNKEQSEVVCQ